jgi:glycosyltransferase involved in cell wall biosynthesis
MRLSIIIPTLNESRDLPLAVDLARRRAVLGPHEMIVADCGSSDGTADIARRLGARLVTGSPPFASRAAALNAAATEASADVFLFLDADTLVPRRFDEAIRRALRDERVVGGAFEFALIGPEISLRLVELINRVRYRIWPEFYGDQGVFSRAKAFRRVGGYPEQLLLESSDFCRRLSCCGELVLLRQQMRTSARRFLDGGVLRVLAQDCWIWWRNLLGLPTAGFGPAYQAYNRQHR